MRNSGFIRHTSEAVCNAVQNTSHFTKTNVLQLIHVFIHITYAKWNVCMNSEQKQCAKTINFHLTSPT